MDEDFIHMHGALQNRTNGRQPALTVKNGADKSLCLVNMKCFSFLLSWDLFIDNCGQQLVLEPIPEAWPNCVALTPPPPLLSDCKQTSLAGNTKINELSSARVHRALSQLPAGQPRVAKR